MQVQASSTLVFMRAGEEDDRTLFSADLYIGHLLRASVYYTRSAMLNWLECAPVGVRADAARAMDQLTAFPDALLRSIPLGVSTEFASNMAHEAAAV